MPPFYVAACLMAAGMLVVACASDDPRGYDPSVLEPPRESSSHYLRYVAFKPPARPGTVMRWPIDKMPLRVHLPAPPEGMFDDPAGVADAVRRGILDWTDVAKPGVPTFRFVEARKDADIPVVWAPASQGWWVAFAAYDLTVDSKIFRVNRILVAARYPDGEVATLEDLYMTMLHETGHALGLIGHSPEPEDVMYEKGHWLSDSLTDRDRNTLRTLYSRSIGSRIAGAKSKEW